MEEAGSESSRKMKGMDETTSEASWTAVTKGKEKEVLMLEPEGEARLATSGKRRSLKP